ncbi:MAG: hypothetical protein KIT84_34170 [Labilithrix sp.]|nr:hypothetical protein [Labilithrix sp.]MCW5816093.1 hypothetical protein [Labilithrix sp.]
MTGVLVDEDEGVQVGDCTAIKHRTELNVKMPSDRCPSSSNPRVVTVTGSRVGTGTTIEGVWEMNVGKAPVFVVEIKDNVAKAWDKGRLLRNEDPSLTASIAGGVATTSGRYDELAFAAKKR